MRHVAMVLAPVLIAVLIAVLILAGCSRNTGLPEPNSDEYRQLVSAFYVGVAALQTGEDVRAKEKLTRAGELAPAEPAVWTNLGLLAVRQQDLETAYRHVEHGRSLAPGNSQIEMLLGFIESRRGKLPEAIAHLQKAVQLDGRNVRAMFALSQEIERQSLPTSDGTAQQWLERILETQPDNLSVLLEVARLAAKRGAGESLRTAVANLSRNSAAWPAEAKQQLVILQQAASGPDPRSAAVQLAFLRNVLARVPDFRRSRDAVTTPDEFVSEPFLRLVKLPSPDPQAAPADLTTSFTVDEVRGVDPMNQPQSMVVTFDSEKPPSLVIYDRNGAQIAGGAKLRFGSPGSAPPHPAAFDFNYDFKTDVVVAGDQGLRFYRQDSINSFADVTAKTGLSAAVLRAAYRGAWTFDFDLDGDLDLIVTPVAPNTSPLVLQNNGDGTFKDVPAFPALRGAIEFAFADVDEDGDPDIAVIDASGLKVLINERLGEFRERRVAPIPGNVIALTAADINADGGMDFVLLTAEGQVLRVSGSIASEELNVVPVAQAAARAAGRTPVAALLVADLDNNGSLDLIVNSSAVLLGESNGKFTAINLPPDVVVEGIADVNNDGKPDLIGIRNTNGASQPVQLINRGTKNYRYQIIRTRAANATGDQRINSFGIGGEIEIRSGLLTQKQLITSSLLHFGLGDNTQVDVARVLWPNGSVQAEFELKSNETVLAEQRLKGSCPMLFAWDGEQMSYVKDTAPWSPALGLHINAQVVAGIYQTEEWFKIRGDQLIPRDGLYDLRVTAELWEVYYIDHYSLMVVDHPEGTEVFADERFAVPAPPLKLYATSAVKPFAKVLDDRGHDVSAVVATVDHTYLDTFGKGPYQGVTRDHWVELELPADAPSNGPLYLIADGSLHPTDGSINIAYSQTAYPQPQSLSIETADENGKWSTAKAGLGFPAGKLKTAVIDLSGIFRPSGSRKLRLRTNMEIYWDRLAWAQGLPDSTLKTARIALSSAELQWRGFSQFTQANGSSPELPDYYRLGTSPKWRNMIGYYTRYGEARDLLEKIDDRMVIVNAGDELRLKFPAAAPPREGWTRDYIMVGDGWIKDGDLNSTFSKTVLPLPYHGLKNYDIRPGTLEEDAAYRRHPQDWQTYHTRYVTPEFFLNSLIIR